MLNKLSFSAKECGVNGRTAVDFDFLTGYQRAGNSLSNNFVLFVVNLGQNQVSCAPVCMLDCMIGIANDHLMHL